MPNTEPHPSPAAGRGRWIVLLGIVAVLVGATQFLPVREWFEELPATVDRLGPWGPVLFVAVYVLATVLFLPGSVLTLGAGAVFGVALGSVYVSIASTLGATAAFLVGRHLARAAVARKLAQSRRFAVLDEAVAIEGWKIVLLTRLSPVFPFALLNYAYGLTRVPVVHYVLASWIGMMPGTVLYVFLGSLATAASGERTRSPAEWVFYGIGLVATLAATLSIARLAKRALARKIPGGSPPPPP